MAYGKSNYGSKSYSQHESFDPVGAAANERTSAFNFCDPFDTVMPFANSTVSALDRQHLWGLSTFLAALSAVGYTPAAASPDDIGRALRHRPMLWWLLTMLLPWV